MRVIRLTEHYVLGRGGLEGGGQLESECFPSLALLFNILIRPSADTHGRLEPSPQVPRPTCVRPCRRL